MNRRECKRRVWGVVILLCMLIVPVASAQLPAIASSSIQIDSSELNNLWFQTMDLLNNRKWVEANLKLQELNQKKIAKRFSNLPAHSMVLITEARRLEEQRNLHEAINVLDSALLLSPDFSAAHFALARVRFKENFTDFYGVTQSLWRGLTLKYSDIHTIVTSVNNWLVTLMFAGILASLIFILVSFLYYRRAIFYQIKEIFPLELPVVAAHILGWGLVVAITLGVGIAWGSLLLAFLLIWRVEAASKGILQLVLFFGTLLPGLFLLIGLTFSTFDGEYFQTLLDIAQDEHSAASVPVLQERLTSDPTDSYALFGLAYIAQQAGEDAEAVEAYEQISLPFPGWASAQNNLGNLYQRQFRRTKEHAWFQRAEEAYKNAIRSAPGMFEPHYNLGKLLLLEFTQSENADSEFQKARKLDNYRFNLYSEQKDAVEFTLDSSFSTRALLQKLLSPDGILAGRTIAERMWRSGSRIQTLWYFSLVSGLVWVMSLLFGDRKGKDKRGICYCQMCGDPYVVKRKKSQEPQTFCTQCTYIFKKKTAVNPEKRTLKIKQIQLRQKVRGVLAKVLSFCMPGAGQIYFGVPGRGICIAFIFYLFLGSLLLKGVFRVVLQGGGQIQFSWIRLGVLCLLLVAIYLFNLVHILKLSPKNQ